MAQFTNQAQLSYNNTVVNSNIVTGEILEVLSATKTAVLSSYSTDDSITYVISAVNAGTSSVSGVSVSDDLGAYEYNGETLYHRWLCKALYQRSSAGSSCSKCRPAPCFQRNNYSCKQ